MNIRGPIILVGLLGAIGLGPLIYGLGHSAYKKHLKADYDRRAEAWGKKMTDHLKPKMSEEERIRLKAKYDQMIKDDIAAKKAEELEANKKLREYVSGIIGLGKSLPIPEDDEDGPRTKTVYVYTRPDPLYEPIQQQPDLSGLYYQRTIGGPNAGQWSMQYIDGPR